MGRSAYKAAPLHRFEPWWKENNNGDHGVARRGRSEKGQDKGLRKVRHPRRGQVQGLSWTHQLLWQGSWRASSAGVPWSPWQKGVSWNKVRWRAHEVTVSPRMRPRLRAYCCFRMASS